MKTRRLVEKLTPIFIKIGRVAFLLGAFLFLTACATDDFTGSEEAARQANGDKAISFGSGLNAITRAEKTGAAAAGDLSRQFFVYGIKNESTDGAGTVASGNLVYNNYVVKWTDNSAFTTTSNTENWEYVGLALTAKEQANVTANSGAAVQTIKYWDYGASDYTFYAFSALPADVENDKVGVVKNQTATSSVYDNGYTVTLAAGADLDHLFFSERVNITNKDNTDRTADNKYGGNVTFKFHNTATKVRVAMYETIPGYSVTINKFKVDNDGTNPGFADMTDAVTANFAANLQYCTTGTAGTLTVKYVATAGTTQNYPTVSFTGTTQKVLQLGNQLKENVIIGTSATEATYDKAEKAYTSVFPNEANAQNLKLKVDYTLTAPVTGETITVEGATAEIPADYLKWKPGFAYTYIFKISDNTNGQTGTGTTPAGLYPITFDAVEVVAEDGQAEYITTVSEPSITTFGAIYDGSKYTAYQTGKNEYQAQTDPNRLDIFATFMEGSTLKTPVLGTSGGQHVNVYAVTTIDATNFPITEASVAEAIDNPAMSVDIYTRSGEEGSYTYTKVTDATTISAETTYYKKDTNEKAPGEVGYTSTEAVAGTDYKVGAKLNITNVNADAATHFSATPDVVATVPGEDGVDITDTHALKLTGVKAGTYAIEYEASTAWTGTYTKAYKIIKVVAP